MGKHSLKQDTCPSEAQMQFERRRELTAPNLPAVALAKAGFDIQ